MKERPILFSGEMVKAILAGTKTLTRRIMKWSEADKPIVHFLAPDGARVSQDTPGATPWPFAERDGSDWPLRCPYGAPGDRLWVRETFARDVPGCEGGISYRADHNDPRGDGPANPMRWTPAIYMPRALSRIDLEITAVRVERLQDISEKDVIAEGVGCARIQDGGKTGQGPLIDGFANLWDTINGERASWESNPWVWVVGFKRVRP